MGCGDGGNGTESRDIFEVRLVGFYVQLDEPEDGAGIQVLVR